MAQNPPTINTIPTPPDVVNRQSTFHADAVAMFTALKTVVPQIDAVGQITYGNAVSVELSAAVANARQWASGSYATGAAVWSPIATAAGTPAVYIRKEPGGASPTDPANDPANWVKYVPSNTTGGAVYTTSTTLTFSSPFAISISGGSGVWLKLPDATTLSTGIRHVVRNTGDSDLTVLDSAGAVIGFIRPQCGTTIALSDVSSAAGKWVGDFEQIGVTADFQFGGTVAGLQNVKQIIQLDASRTMVITGGSNGQWLWTIVYDTTTQSAGAPVMIRAAAWGAMAVKSAADQVLCVAFDNSNPGNLYATALNVSGTSVTVNTAVNAAITGQFTVAGNWVAVGGAFCLSYNNGSYGVARVITISGTTPSIGAEQSAAASGAPRLYVSGSTLRAVRVSSSSTVTCTPYSVSGNTLTAGTTASTATAINESAVRSFQYAGGDIGVLHASDGYWVASIFKLTSTTEAVLSVNIRSRGTLSTGSITENMFDYSVVDSTKIQFACVLNSDYSIFSTNNIVNNSGSPTAGTALDYSNAVKNEVGASSVLEVVCATGERGFIISHQRSTYPTYACNLMLFDASGVSPVRTKVFNLADKIPSNTALPYGLPKSIIGVLRGQLCSNSRGTFNITGISEVLVGTPSGLFKFIPNSASAYVLGASGAQIPYKTQPLFRAAGSVRGENNQTTWAVMPLTTVPESSLGVALQRIQIAQV